MPPRKTTIVLGAGASAEADLPTGNELKRNIAASLTFAFDLGELNSGDRTMYYTLQQEPRSNQCFYAAEMIRRGLPQASSIDQFIDNHRGDIDIERCGKLAIVRSILRAERRSYLYVDPNSSYNELNFSSVEDTWFNSFWQRITEDCQADQLKERFLSTVFIVFNYDRCLEHYLYRSIQNYFGLSADDAGDIVRSIKIYHPYGTIGSLPWSGDQAKVEFGFEPDPRTIGSLANEIKTFAEGTNPESSDVEIIRYHVSSAERLIFLGFAYHPQNIALLGGDEKFRVTSTECWGTADGVSEDNRQRIERQLQELYGKDVLTVNLEAIKCRELFERFSRALSFV